MRIVVLGAGALGTVIGAVLSKAGDDVMLVSRNRAHVDAINEHGARLRGADGEQAVEVAASSRPPTGAEPDLVIVLVKSFDTTAAIESIAPGLGEDSVVLTLQNGVGCEEMIADVVGRGRVIAGRTFVGGSMLAPGLVEYGVAGRRTTIGELDGTETERIRSVAATFRRAGLEVDVSTDIVATMWEKLFVNVATGAWSALTRLPYGELSVHADVERMAVATVAEAIAVARALGVSVSTTDPAEPWRRAWEGLPFGFKASMLQSVEKGSRTEVDVMHGAVCDGGRLVGVPTPVNDTLLAAVRGLERRLEIDD